MRESIKSAIYALAIGALVVVAVNQCARAHDAWSDGTPVPAWAKASCCGPQDVHHLKPEQVHSLPDGIHVDGLSTVIPYNRVLPSPDGTYWGFWNPAVADPMVFCFFAPMQGS